MGWIEVGDQVEMEDDRELITMTQPQYLSISILVQQSNYSSSSLSLKTYTFYKFIIIFPFSVFPYSTFFYSNCNYISCCCFSYFKLVSIHFILTRASANSSSCKNSPRQKKNFTEKKGSQKISFAQITSVQFFLYHSLLPSLELLNTTIVSIV